MAPKKYWFHKSKIYLMASLLCLFGVSLTFLKVYLDQENRLAIAAGAGAAYNEFLIAVLQSLSQVLLISGVISFFAELAFRTNMLDDFSERTERILEKFFNRTLAESSKYGLVGIRDSINFKNFFSETRPGDTVLWLDTYAPDHVNWLGVVKEKALAGVNFRFLILEPGCDQASYRGKEIGGRFIYAFDKELRIFFDDLLTLVDEVNAQASAQRIEIKYYSDLLAIPFYVVVRGENQGYAASSFYLREATGVAFPHLEWDDNEGGFVTMLKDYFQWKWENSKPVTAEFREQLQS